MPRTTLTKTAAPGSYGNNGVAVTMTGADVASKNRFVATDRDLIIAQNTDSTAHTVTITSVADPFGRTGDVTAVSLAAGEIRVFGPMALVGWLQSDGGIWLEANSALVKFGIVALPS